MQIDLTNLPNVDARLVPVLSEYLEKLIECEESNGIDLKSGKLIKDIKEGKVVFLVKEEEAQGERSNWRNRGVNFCEVVVIDSKMVNDIEIVGHEIEHWFDGGLTVYPFFKEPINEICSAYIIYGDEETAKAQLRKKKDHPYYARVQFVLTLCKAANVTLEELLTAHRNDDIDFFYSLFPEGVQELLAIDSLENIIFDKRLRGENNATVEVALLYDIIKELEAKIEPCYVSENDSGNQNGLFGIFQGYEEFLQEYTGYESVVQGRILRENCNLTPQAIGEITADIFPALQYCSKEDILFQIYRKNAFLNPTSHNNASLSFLTGCLIMRREVEAAKNNIGEEGLYILDESIGYFLRKIIFCGKGNFNSGLLDFQNNILEAKECEEPDGNITYQEFGRQVKFML